jgi:transcriptional regulator with XRE-family HTH domain
LKKRFKLDIYYPMKKFGEYLRNQRLEAGLTQTEVSKFLSYTPQFICNWEKGKSMPPFDKLYQLAKLYKINPEVLLQKILAIQEQLLRSHLKIKSKGKKTACDLSV